MSSALHGRVAIGGSLFVHTCYCCAGHFCVDQKDSIVTYQEDSMKVLLLTNDINHMSMTQRLKNP